MFSHFRLLVFFALLFSALIGTAFPSPPGEFPDRTLSPYFFVKSDDPQLDQLPLKSTSANVNISGVIADVKVTQVYKNQGQRPIEAVYVFPASTRAAVYGMKMIIGERTIQAQIQKREDARKTYEQARDQGKSASLLEQQRPNVFQMNVANILPGDEIKVELKYTELLVPTDRIYEFVCPTVVGPRYSNQRAEVASPSEQWLQNPYLHQGQAPSYTFGLGLSITAGLPIKDLNCPSHKIVANFDGPATAKIIMDKSETHGGNRDFVLRYRLDGDRIQSGLLLNRGEKENYFLLMVQPPKRVAPSQIPGREYIFIVDVSGSMHGFPLEISKKLLRDLIGNLLSTDRFNVLLFSGGSSVMAPESLPATPENLRQALHLINRQRGGGGTELLPAMERALNLKKAENYSRTLVIATDGYVAVEEQAFDLIRNNLGNANMFAFGIGTAVNRHLIEGMARVGMGEPFVITRPEEAPAQAERFRTLIQSPVLTRVQVKFNGFNAYDVEPVRIPDVFAERPVIVFGKWHGEAKGRISLSGISGDAAYREEIEVRRAKQGEENSALRYLWARHRITLLSDYNHLRPSDSRIKEVTDLGLTYNLLTAYTSFVAVDTEVRNAGGQQTLVKQPLPLPQGVSDYAVGGMIAQAPAASSFLARKESASLSGEKTLNGLLRDQSRPKEKEGTMVMVTDVSVSEGLSKEAIMNLFKQKAHELENCSLGKESGDKVVIELILNQEGKVKEAKILSAARYRSVEECLLSQLQKWRFPQPQNGREVKVTLSLSFRG